MSPELRKMAEEAALIYRGAKSKETAFTEIWGKELEAFARLVAEDCMMICFARSQGNSDIEIEAEKCAMDIRAKYGIKP